MSGIEALANGVLPAAPVKNPAPGAAAAEIATPPPGEVSTLRAVPPTQTSLSVAVEVINRALLDAGRELSFAIDESSGRTIVRVLATHSGELVRQMPSPEALILAERLLGGDSPTSLGLDAWS